MNQYFPEVRNTFTVIKSVPLELLVWFHHLPWDYRLRTNRTLWEEFNVRYNSGVEYVDHMYDAWEKLENKVDESRYKSVLTKLNMEKEYSRLWRDRCLSYFAEVIQRKGIDKEQKK